MRKKREGIYCRWRLCPVQTGRILSVVWHELLKTVTKTFLGLLSCFLYLHRAVVLVVIFALGSISLLVPQSECFSCRTSKSSTSGELPVTQPSVPVHLPAASSAPYQLPVLRWKTRHESWDRSGSRTGLSWIKRSCTPRRQWGKKLPSNPSYFFSETHPGLLHILAWKLAVKETRKRYHTLTSPRALIMSGHLTLQRHFKNGTVMKDLHDTAIANNTRALQGTYSGLLRSLPSVCSFMTWLCPSADRPLALRSFPKTQPVFLILPVVTLLVKNNNS